MPLSWFVCVQCVYTRGKVPAVPENIAAEKIPKVIPLLQSSTAFLSLLLSIPHLHQYYIWQLHLEIVSDASASSFYCILAMKLFTSTAVTLVPALKCNVQYAQEFNITA